MRLLFTAALLVSALGIVASVSSGCGMGLPPGAQPCSTDSCPIAEAPKTCSANGDFFVVPATACGYLCCAGKVAYALCTGAQYTACTCTDPTSAGWMKTGDFDSGPTDSGSFQNFETGSGSTGHDSGPPPADTGADTTPPADTSGATDVVVVPDAPAG
jgi:hypothetical protein